MMDIFFLYRFCSKTVEPVETYDHKRILLSDRQLAYALRDMSRTKLPVALCCFGLVIMESLGVLELSFSTFNAFVAGTNRQ
jgi:hypothetical protein